MTQDEGADVTERLNAILEGIGEGFYAVDENWRIVLFNGEAARHFRCKPEDCLGRVLWEAFPGSRETSLGRMFLDTMERRTTVRSEAASVVFKGQWMAYRLFPLENGMGVVFRDITDRRNAEEQRDLLIKELNHRVKNTLALVSAIATRSFPSGRHEPAFGNFSARLMALSKAHMLLTDVSWEGVDLREVVSSIVEPHLDGDESRVEVDGAPLSLSPRRAVTFSMALHELATNAAKYGALSVPGGKISITWGFGDKGFVFSWIESDGPAVSAPTRRGFGSQMIERALAAELEGVATLNFAQSGLECVIETPASAMQEPAMVSLRTVAPGGP